MSQRISKRVEKLTESETLKMAQMARQLAAEGKDIINLSIGEPDFDTPDHIKEAAIKAIHNNITHYPPVPGFPELRKAIAEKHKNDFDVEYDFSQVIVSNGAKQSLSNAILSVLNEGDEVIVPAPYWVSYPEMIKLADATMIVVSSAIENDYKITPEQLEKAISPRTRMLLYSSPSNPSGGVYCMKELEALAEVLRKHPDIFILADEIYDHINFLGKMCSFSEITDLKERTIIVNGVSKGYAMTGWRIGWMIAPPDVAKACNKLQGQLTSGPCTISQMAALAAVSEDISPTLKMRDEFLKRRDIVIDKLKNIPNIKFNKPDGAFYSLIDVSYFYGRGHNGEIINNSGDMAMYLLSEAAVSTVSGDAFGVPETIRISFATSESKLIDAIERIKTALSKLK